MTKRNENRKGYKKTKVGWIPEEWQCLPFGEVVDKAQYGLSVAATDDGDTGIVGMANIQDGTVILGDDLAKVKLSTNELKKYILKKDDFLFNRTNSYDLVGKSARVSENLNVVFASYLIRFNIKKDNCVQFVNYYFNDDDTICKLKSFATPGVSQCNINPTYLQNHFNIPRPPLPEQKKIAEILSTWDKAIDQVRKLIEAKKKLKKGLMQQLLTGRMRFPGFGKPVKRNGELPEGWEEISIKEFGHVVTGNTPPKKSTSNYGQGIPWCTAIDMENKYVSKTVVELSKVGKSCARILPKGTVLVTCIASIGRNAIAKVVLATNQQINSVVINKENNNEFFYYLICFIDKKLQKIAGKTAVPIISKSQFENIKIIRPEKLEQEKISNILSSCDEHIGFLEDEIEKIQNQKKGLMQKLLTGEIRVKV